MVSHSLDTIFSVIPDVIGDPVTIGPAAQGTAEETQLNPVVTGFPPARE